MDTQFSSTCGGQTAIKDTISALSHLYFASQYAASAAPRYLNEFLIPYLTATNYFGQVETKRLPKQTPQSNIRDYSDLWKFNMALFHRALIGSFESFWEYFQLESGKTIDAVAQMLASGKTDELATLTNRHLELMEVLAHRYPQAIQDIEPEYGFHFERGLDPLVGETDRFLLYQVMPTHTGVTVRQDGKPILILPPYVLGANILSFLPGDNRSYTHAFANQGIPTYIRILKDIDTTDALQTMSGDDDANDTRQFCETIRERHGKAVTLNGYCQGGFSGLCNLLSGELDELVDAFVTCVAPMDGTRSTGLSGFLSTLPQRFNDLAYGTKTMPNGNRVADGKLMGWVYKLKSIEDESPIAAFFRDLMMFARQGDQSFKISKTAAALNYWLNNERNDLPMEITRMSFASYNTPITDDGTLPVRLFGRKLNINRLKEKQIPWLICYGEHDDLVEKSVALAPLDWVPAEVTPFPKGHVAIATSWSDPNSACALHTRFGKGNWPGPVRFQLDLDADDPAE
jgi:hypothetical protein